MDDEAERWAKLKCTQLRAELKKRRLSTTGNKTALISRLCDNRNDTNNNNVSAEDRLREFYGKMKNDQLKILLRQRNAVLKGKKKDLVDRLVFYELNSNFVVPSTPDDDLEDVNVLQPPALDKFKDIHSQCPLPPFSKQDIKLYLSRFNKGMDRAEEMYAEGFLEFARFCNTEDFTFFFGKCRAEMRKSARYEIYCKITPEGEVEGCTCECTHGKSSGEAHCKHVCVVLLGVAQVKQEGYLTTELTCTQQFQTFHHPNKKFKGIPLRAYQLKPKSSKGNMPTVDEHEEPTRDIIEYRTFFRNVIINGTYGMNVPWKHLIPPANPYAIYSDHTYSKYSTADLLLDSLQLRSISKEQIQDIEKETRGQSSSPRWHEVRETRLTASRFYEVIHAKNPETRASAIVNPTKFTSRATNHGLKYESVAVQKYQEENDEVNVTTSGIVLMESYPFIAASPDFLIGADGVGDVKCPYTTRNQPVGPTYQPYLRFSKTNQTVVKLKKTHQYYYQAQGLLLVTGRNFCDFIVYTFKDMKTIRIMRKENFISLMLFKLINFYDDYLKPAILNKFLWRNFDKYIFPLDCECIFCCKIPIL